MRDPGAPAQWRPEGVNRRGGVTEVTYGFTAALGGEIHAQLASP